MSIYTLADKKPNIAEDVFVFDTAAVIGDVVLAEQVSIWASACLRGDNERITIGKGSNVQECAVLHTDIGAPLVVGEYVTIGHQAMLHGCNIGSGTLIGMQAIILNHARIGKNCLIGAGALIPEGREIPDGSLVVGSPGKIIRSLSPEDIERILKSAYGYIEKSQIFQKHLVQW